ncbi:unnamed protein product [Effrenium voratum]|nr:unnamed protein product [Effrenium voratum]
MPGLVSARRKVFCCSLNGFNFAFEDLDDDQVSCLAATLQPGKALVAAGYVLYSCSTELVFTLGRGVVGFTLDSSIGEYVLTRPNITIPTRGKIYSCNEANIENWDEPMQKYIRDRASDWKVPEILRKFLDGGLASTELRSSMADVADVFRVYAPTGRGVGANTVLVSQMDVRGFMKSMREACFLDEHFSKVDADLAFFRAARSRRLGQEDYMGILKAIARRREVSEEEVFQRAADTAGVVARERRQEKLSPLPFAARQRSAERLHRERPEPAERAVRPGARSASPSSGRGPERFFYDKSTYTGTHRHGGPTGRGNGLPKEGFKDLSEVPLREVSKERPERRALDRWKPRPGRFGAASGATGGASALSAAVPDKARCVEAEAPAAPLPMLLGRERSHKELKAKEGPSASRKVLEATALIGTRFIPVMPPVSLDLSAARQGAMSLAAEGINPRGWEPLDKMSKNEFFEAHAASRIGAVPLTRKRPLRSASLALPKSGGKVSVARSAQGILKGTLASTRDAASLGDACAEKPRTDAKWNSDAHPDIQTGQGETKEKYSLRYIGSMVGDVHRTLLYGGLFAYPADTKNKDGKLRLLYEAAPMSFLLEQAGGLATTGHNRVMDIPPTSVHQRVPIVLGSKEDVEECRKYYDESDDPKLKERCANRLKGLVTS